MTTLAEAREAPRHAQDQRWRLRALVRVDEARAAAEDKPLLDRFQAVSDPHTYDKALASKQVNDLFVRGVIVFGERR
jgi:hypothetical protein